MPRPQQPASPGVQNERLLACHRQVMGGPLQTGSVVDAGMLRDVRNVTEAYGGWLAEQGYDDVPAGGGGGGGGVDTHSVSDHPMSGALTTPLP